MCMVLMLILRMPQSGLWLLVIYNHSHVYNLVLLLLFLLFLLLLRCGCCWCWFVYSYYVCVYSLLPVFLLLLAVVGTTKIARKSLS